MNNRYAKFLVLALIALCNCGKKVKGNVDDRMERDERRYEHEHIRNIAHFGDRVAERHERRLARRDERRSHRHERMAREDRDRAREHHENAREHRRMERD